MNREFIDEDYLVFCASISLVGRKRAVVEHLHVSQTDDLRG
jgi:hypothetical protein